MDCVGYSAFCWWNLWRNSSITMPLWSGETLSELASKLDIFFFYILALQADNIFASYDSGLWRELSPVEIFIIGYGVRDYWYMFLRDYWYMFLFSKAKLLFTRQFNIVSRGDNFVLWRKTMFNTILICIALCASIGAKLHVAQVPSFMEIFPLLVFGMLL